MWFIVRPDARLVWRYEEVRERLEWYKAVMDDKMPAKYLIVKRVPTNLKPSTATLEELWKEHERLGKVFMDMWEKIRRRETKLEDYQVPSRSFLDVKIEIVKRLLEECIFCERRCRVNRAKGEKGACGLDARTRVASWFHHVGEEAPLVPSGTIFFTGCSFKCVYCQNWDISQHPDNGVEVTPKELASIAEVLRKEGARNINYVGGNPDQQLHTIMESLRYMDVNVPLLWNSNFYMTEEAMKILIHVIDIWLPDFKYGNNNCALRLSGIPRYFDVATRNLYIASKHGDMIIRHLVLPGHFECCTKPVLEWIAKHCNRALVNIMSQYRPEYLVEKSPGKWPEIYRRPTPEEMLRAYDLAEKLGLAYKHVS
ncbi:MAG: pyruvate formate lyase-activating protein [Thermoprotei archaeon]|nr:MAG: pyruvate formate lyase-activating protein [Thermoprotei archaeon]